MLSQLLRLVPRHEFEALARTHHQGQRLRATSRWDQFVALLVGQLGDRLSLRDVEASLAAQQPKLYHLGARGIRRSSLARLNEAQPYTLFEGLFDKLLSRMRHVRPGHRFDFRSPLYSLDSSVIELSLEAMPWADQYRGKGAVKLHVGLNHAGHYPEVVKVSDGHAHDITVGRTLSFPAGSTIICDRGYLSYSWYKSLMDRDLFFVTRQRANAVYRVVGTRGIEANSDVEADLEIELTGRRNQEGLGPMRLRRIEYVDSETGRRYAFLTNHYELSAETIAALYKARWQVELFFKALKQTLKIKSFLGTSRNAVLTQIWVAMCVYLLLAYLRFSAKLEIPMKRMVRLMGLSLFERRSLIELLRPVRAAREHPPPQLRMALA